jgi:hypothetical protein
MATTLIETVNQNPYVAQLNAASSAVTDLD